MLSLADTVFEGIEGTTGGIVIPCEKALGDLYSDVDELNPQLGVVLSRKAFELLLKPSRPFRRDGVLFVRWG